MNQTMTTSTTRTPQAARAAAHAVEIVGVSKRFGDVTALEEVSLQLDSGEFLAVLGWRPVQVIDLGGIDTAAAVEMTMSLWMRVTIARGSDAPRFNWAISSG